MKLKTAKKCASQVIATCGLLSLLGFASPLKADCPMEGSTKHWTEASTVDIKGTLVDVMIDRSCRGHQEVLQFKVQSEGREYLVHLGPVSFVNSRKFVFGLGDEIHVLGVALDSSSGNVIVAREIDRMGKKLSLRDENGLPLWPTKRQGPVESKASPGTSH